MKKKQYNWFVLCLCIFVVVLSGCMFSDIPNQKTSGRYFVSPLGDPMLYIEDNLNGPGPARLIDKTIAQKGFESLTTGDRIEITHGSFPEILPLPIEVVSYKIIEHGSLDDLLHEIPKDTLDFFVERGYIDLSVE